MVGHLKPGLLVMLLTGGLAHCVEAADLADPTRPPPEFAAAPTDAADAGAFALPLNGRLQCGHEASDLLGHRAAWSWRLLVQSAFHLQ